MKRIRAVPFFLVTLTSLMGAGYAQTPPATGAAASGGSEAPRPATIMGVVRNASNSKPAADVVVTIRSSALPDGEQLQVTNAKGAFTFKNLPPGSYTVSYDSTDYKPNTRSFTATAGSTVAANVELIPEELFIEQVVYVTGTRIPRLDITSPAPVTALSREQFTTSGRTSVGDLLQTLPEQTGGINTQANNGGDGSTRINLRGFGTNRTLVLVNGRRMVPGGTGADATVDLNSIPASAIERIEILKDGASAIYGSDAISGVVNIITRTDYDSTEISTYTGLSQRGDGGVMDVAFTTGQHVATGHILFTGQFTRTTPVWARHRDFSRYDYGVAGYDWQTGKKFTGGSSAIPNGRFRKPSGMGNAAWEALKEQYPDATNFTIGKDGNWRPFNGSGVEDAGGDFYNYQPQNYLVTPQLRLNLFSTGSFKLLGSMHGYYEALYTHRESSQKLAEEPLFTSQEGLTVSRDNVYNPWGVDFSDVRRRLVEFSNRNYEQDLDTFRLVVGVKGNFRPTWTWDVNVNYGRTQGVSTKSGLLQRSKLANALGPSFIDPDGVPRCGAPGAVIDGCVPVNLFGGAGTISPAARDSLTYNGTARGYNQQVMITAMTAGEIVKVGTAKVPMGFAVGYEHRREAGASIQDPLTAKGDTTGTKAADTQGSYSVHEAYAELNVPLLERVGKFAGEGTMLELSAAARFVNFSSFGANLAYKGGLRFSPIKDATLRGTFSTAFRAPSVGELYLGAADSFPNVTDPCSGRTQGSDVDKACDAQGVPEDLVDDRSQILARIGGNSKLKPERATAFTIGAVFQPRWVKDLDLTVDYYNIEVKDAIQSVTSDVILASCFPAAGGVNGAYCDRITRGADGLIRTIADPLSNVGGDHVSGVDFQLDYTPQTPIGALGFLANVNYLGFYDRTLADGRVIQAKGTYDLDLVLPDWKGNFSFSYGKGGWGGTLNVRWLGGFRECEGNACQQTDPTAPPARTRDVEAYVAADLNIAYKMTHKGGSSSNFALGVNNLLDRAPAYIVNGFSAASDTSAYDYMGRYFYLRMSHELK